VPEHTGMYLPQAGIMSEDDPNAAGVPASAVVLGGTFPGSMWPAANPGLRIGAFLKGPNTSRMSLFLWMVRAAWAAGATVYVETVVDAEALQLDIGILMSRIRFFIPLSVEQLDTFLAVTEASMETEQEGGAGPSAYKASWQNINSAQSFMQALEVMMCQPLGQQFATLSFATPVGPNAASGDRGLDGDESTSDSDLEGAVGSGEARPTFPANSPLTLLDASHVFLPRFLEDDREYGAHAHQLEQGTYIGSVGELGFPQYSAERRLLYKMEPGLGGALAVDDVDGLLSYNLWVDQLTVNELLADFIQQQASDGRMVPPEAMEATTLSDLKEVIRETVGGGAVNMCRPVLAPKWPNQTEDAENNSTGEMAWPWQTAAVYFNQKIMKSTRRLLRAGQISKAKARAILDKLLCNIAAMTYTEHEGINPVYCLVQRDCQRLSNDIERKPARLQSQSASVAKRTFRMLLKKYNGQTVPPSTGLMIQLALAAGGMNMAPAQADAWQIIWTSGFILLYNVWGLQLGFILMGPPDVGKSILAFRIIQCAPRSLGHETHQESGQVTSLHRPIGFKWVDEQDKGRVSAGKKGPPTPEELSLMMALTSGHRTKTLYNRGNPQEGIPHVNVKTVAEGRHVGIDLGNHNFDNALKSRKAVIGMVGSDEGDDVPGKDERALRTVTPEEHGRQLCMQLRMCYGNMCWIPQAFGLQQCPSMVWLAALSIFHSLVTAILVPAGFEKPPPRAIERLKKKAIGHMVYRVMCEFETSGRTLAERDRDRYTNFMRNAVVSFSDVLVAWRELSGLRDDRQEQRQLLQILKAHIRLKSEELDTHFVSTATQPDFYVTSISYASMSEYCPDFGEGLLDALIKRLLYPVNNKAMVVKFDNGDEKGFVGVRKSTVDSTTCLTPNQELIVALLARVVRTPVAGARLWYPEVDQAGVETGNVAFTKAVLEAVLKPALSTMAEFKGWHGSVSSTDIRVAFDQFIIAGGMRETTDARTALSITVHCPMAQGMQMAKPGGLLDPSTVFRGIAAYDAHVDATVAAPSVAQRTQWAAEMEPMGVDPVVVPGPVPAVANLTIHGGLLVTKNVAEVMYAITADKCEKCKMKPPVAQSQDDIMNNAYKHFIDLLMAASGEAQPGQAIYSCSDGGATPPFTLQTVGACDQSKAVRILNPKRADLDKYKHCVMVDTDAGEAVEYDVDPVETILPSGQKHVLISPGDELFPRLLQMHREYNVPELA